MYVNQAHNTHSTNVTGKNYGFSILVFQDNTSKNQDFFHDFFSTHVQFQDFSGPVGTLKYANSIWPIKIIGHFWRDFPFNNVYYSHGQ